MVCNIFSQNVFSRTVVYFMRKKSSGNRHLYLQNQPMKQSIDLLSTSISIFQFLYIKCKNPLIVESTVIVGTTEQEKSPPVYNYKVSLMIT